MEKQYKTFEDLEFGMWGTLRGIEEVPDYYIGARQAVMYFENGYGVSVLLGHMFYSNGISTFELGVLKDGKLVYPEEVCPDGDVLGYITEEGVTEAMRKVQDL